MTKTKKRALTPADFEASDTLKAAIADAKRNLGKTQQSIGEEVGVSQGMIWQWANRTTPVPADRARALATAVGIDDPGLISIEWRATIKESTPENGVAIGEPVSSYELPIPETLSAMGRQSLQRIIDAAARADGRLDEFLQKIADGLEQAADRAPDGRVRELRPGHLFLVHTVSMIAGTLPEKQAKTFADLIWQSVPPESDMQSIPVLEESAGERKRKKRPSKTPSL